MTHDRGERSPAPHRSPRGAVRLLAAAVLALFSGSCSYDDGGAGPGETVSVPTAAGPAVVSAGKVASYSAQGAASSAGHPLEHRFDWGNNVISPWGGESQDHTWDAAASYPVRAQARCQAHTDRVSDWSEVRNVVVGTITVPTTPSGPSSGFLDESLSYTTGGSSSSLGRAIEYQFSWGDGAESTWGQPTASHAWSDPGSYCIKARARNGTAIESAFSPCTTVTITAEPESCSALASPAAGTVPLDVDFTGMALAGQAPFVYGWDFGDGGTSTQQNPSHTYSSTGTFTAILTVTDSQLQVCTDSLMVTVSPPLSGCGAAGSPSSGTAPLTVNFSGNTTGGQGPYAYDWDFGDGATGNGPNPTHTYASAGTYGVNMTVTDALAQTCQDNLTVTVSPPPLGCTAQGTPTSGTAPLTATFTGTGTGGQGPYAYDWDFGDGGTANVRNPVHNFSNPGSFDVTLVVTDALQQTCQDGLTVTVSPPPSNCSASANPTSGTSPLTVSFTGTGAGGQAPYTYDWDFGDGPGGSTQQSPTHTYTAAGTFSVLLTVTDAAQQVCQDSLTITVTAPALTCSASGNPPSGRVPLTVSFSAAHTGGQGPFLYDWDFGDGGTSTQRNPQHTYNSSGTYPVTLTVMDAVSQTCQDSLTITVSPPPANCGASANPTSGTVPLTVNFTGTGSGGQGPYTYSWDFGDGGTSPLQNPTNIYMSHGTFTVRLTVTDILTQTCQDSLTIFVAPPTLSCSAGASPTSGNAPLTVSFTGSGSGGVPPFDYHWAFGDGNTSTLQNPMYTYSSAGTYTATLTVDDAASQSCQDGRSIVVSAPPTNCNATASPTSGISPLTVSFTGTGSGGQGPYSYDWDFGDGSTTAQQNPSHTYTAPGTYSATLTVTDALSQICQDGVTIDVSPPPLSCGASGSPTSGTSPLNVTFTGNRTGGAGPYTYSWDFGDGNGSNQRSPTHTYNAAGTYSARFTVSDAFAQTCQDSVSISVSAPPLTCGASAVPTAGTAPLTVNFTGSRTGGQGPYSWNWDFRDGSAPSTQQNPSHTFTTAGLYMVLLDVGDAASQSCRDSVAITVLPAPANCGASSDRTSGIIPLTVNFTGNGTGGQPPFTYDWDFGDGSRSSQQNPAHTYISPGAFVALLTVTDSQSQNCRDSLTISASPPPVGCAAVGSPTSGTAPLAVSFTAGRSGGQPPYSYDWSFGDGATSTQRNPPHTYASAGSYVARLTVTDSFSQTCQDSVAITVSVPPLACGASGNPTSGTSPLSVNFTGSGSGGQAPFSYDWDFGDGGTSTAQSPSHTYATPGTYTAALTVSDGAAQTCQDSVTVTVSAPPLGCGASGNPTSGTTPLDVDFTGSGSGGQGPYTFDWDFGDGNASNQQNPSHTYALPGTYTVNLTVGDALSQSCQDGLTVTATAPAVLNCSAAGNPTSGTAPLPVSFSGSGSGGQGPYSYSWDFGDGAAGSTQQNPAHTYTSPGTYTAALTVMDALSQTCQDSVTIIVSAPPLSCGASGSPTSGTAPLGVSFTGSGSGGQAPFTYDWDFGDGNTDTQQNPSHSYTVPGSYTATLTVTDALAQTCQDSVSVTVSAPPLGCGVSGNPTSGTTPLDVDFTGSGFGGQGPYTFDWDFGDGNTSNQQNPSHTYALPGTYTVNLTVGDALSQSCQDGLTVTATAPAVLNCSAAGNPTSGTAPLPVSFTGSGSGGQGPYSYSWDFGDGAAGSTQQNPAHTYTSPWTYTAALTVMDALSQTCQDSVAITVSAPPLGCGASGSPTSGTPPLNVSFTGSGSGGQAPFTYDWDFGDGSTSTQQNPSYTYTTPGSYTAMLTVTDALSQTCQDSVKVTVSAPPLTCGASGTPVSGLAPLPVTFTGSGSGGQAPLTYDWDFGDGGTSTQQSPSYTYNTPGAYVATLTVTDALSQTCQDSVSIAANVDVFVLLRFDNDPAVQPWGEYETNHPGIVQDQDLYANVSSLGWSHASDTWSECNPTFSLQATGSVADAWYFPAQGPSAPTAGIYTDPATSGVTVEIQFDSFGLTDPVLRFESQQCPPSYVTDPGATCRTGTYSAFFTPSCLALDGYTQLSFGTQGSTTPVAFSSVKFTFHGWEVPDGPPSTGTVVISP